MKSEGFALSVVIQLTVQNMKQKLCTNTKSAMLTYV